MVLIEGIVHSLSIGIRESIYFDTSMKYDREQLRGFNVIGCHVQNRRFGEQEFHKTYDISCFLGSMLFF